MRILDVNLHAGAELAGVLVKRRLEPARPQPTAVQPVRRERLHSATSAARIDVGRAEELERSRRAAAFGQRRAFEHDRAGVARAIQRFGAFGLGLTQVRSPSGQP